MTADWGIELNVHGEFLPAAVTGTGPAACPSGPPPGKHPRGCGKQRRPLMQPISWPGTFPAGAWSKLTYRSVAPENEEHSRGAGSRGPPEPRFTPGTSPRAQGTVRGPAAARRRGSIPAGAGSRLNDLRVQYRPAIISMIIEGCGKSTISGGGERQLTGRGRSHTHEDGPPLPGRNSAGAHLLPHRGEC